LQVTLFRLASASQTLLAGKTSTNTTWKKFAQLDVM